MSAKRAVRGHKWFFGNSHVALGAETLRDFSKGIETEAETRTLQALVAPWGQGFHMGPPEDIASITSPISTVR
jgi:EAL domain-containing protein (putative c-di-GMP-specific phosphodiesterase class I)